MRQPILWDKVFFWKSFLRAWCNTGLLIQTTKRKVSNIYIWWCRVREIQKSKNVFFFLYVCARRVIDPDYTVRRPASCLTKQAQQKILLTRADKLEWYLSILQVHHWSVVVAGESTRQRANIVHCFTTKRMLKECMISSLHPFPLPTFLVAYNSDTLPDSSSRLCL